VIVTISKVTPRRGLRRKDAPFRHRDGFLVGVLSCFPVITTHTITTHNQLNNKSPIQQIQRVEEGMWEEDVEG